MNSNDVSAKSAGSLSTLEASTAKLVDMAGKPIEVSEGDIREALPLVSAKEDVSPPNSDDPGIDSGSGGAGTRTTIPELRRSLLTVRLTHDNMTELLADVCATKFPWIGRLVAEWLPDETGKPLAVCEVSLVLPAGMSYDEQEHAFILCLGKEGRKNRDMRETIKGLRDLLDRYDSEATRCRNLLTQAGVPEVIETAEDEDGNISSTSLGLPERLKILSDRARAHNAGSLTESGRSHQPASVAP